MSLLDDGPSTSNLAAGGGGGIISSYDYPRGASGNPALNLGKVSSMPPVSYGGNTRSNYTGSEGDSEYETHS